MLALAKRIIHVAGGRNDLRFVEGRPGDPERRRPVIKRMQARYGWSPRVQLTDGLRRTIAAFRGRSRRPLSVRRACTTACPRTWSARPSAGVARA